MPPLVAVTGATGFVGGHVVERLAQGGWRIRILTRRLPAVPKTAEADIEAVIGSLEDQRALARLVDGVDAIVHAAGLIKAHTHAEFFAANAAGTRLLVEAAVRQGNRPKLVLISSIAARHPRLSDYAASKMASEAELIRLTDQLPWTILRPAAVYGPGDRETLAFFQAIGRGIALLPPVRTARLSLIHAEDLAAATVAVLESPSTVGGIYEVDDERDGGYDWEDLLRMAAPHIGRRHLRLRIPAPILLAAAHLNAFVRRRSRHPPMLTPGKIREMLHPDWVAHGRSLSAATEWRPQHKADTGFAETIAWYRQHGWM